MEITFARPAKMVLEAFITVALSAFVCFGQSSPVSAAKAHTARHSSSAKQVTSQSVSPSRKVVMTVNNVKVTKEEMDFIFNRLSPQARRAVAAHGLSTLGQEYSLMLLLSQKAHNDGLDASPDFQLELALKKHQMLAQIEYQKLASQADVTSDEVSTYYAAHKGEFEEADIREFVVRKKAENAKPGDPGLSPEEAKARLDSIRKAVLAGTSIAQVAKQYDVANVVLIDSEPRTVRRGELLPALDKAAFELKDNQFSEPVDTPQAMVELQVLSHHQPNLKDVSQSIEKLLRRQKVQVAIDDLRAKAKIWMDPAYFKSSAPEASSSAGAPPTPTRP